MNGGQKAKPSWKKSAASARLWHPSRRLRKTIQRYMTSRDTVDYLNPSKISPMKIELVKTVVALSGQHQVEGAGTEQVERLLAAGHLPNLPVVALQETGPASLDGGVGIDEQQAAGAQNISTL